MIPDPESRTVVMGPPQDPEQLDNPEFLGDPDGNYICHNGPTNPSILNNGPESVDHVEGFLRVSHWILAKSTTLPFCSRKDATTAALSFSSFKKITHSALNRVLVPCMLCFSKDDSRTCTETLTR